MLQALKQIETICKRSNMGPPRGELFECCNCNARFTVDQLDDTRLQTYPGDFTPGIGGNPPEWIDVCPECGARESMEGITYRRLLDEEEADV